VIPGLTVTPNYLRTFLCTGDICAGVVGRNWYKNCKKKKQNHESNTSYHRAIRERDKEKRK